MNSKLDASCTGMILGLLTSPSLCRSDHHWRKIVIAAWVNEYDDAYRDQAYMREFRLKYRQFWLIVEKVGPKMRRKDTKFRGAIKPAHRIACAVYRLAHGASNSQLSSHFGIGASTDEGICNEFCAILSKIFLNTTVKLPDRSSLIYHLNSFAMQKRFPGCFGAIDGSHIAIEKPSCASHASYHNRKHFYNIVLSAVVILTGSLLMPALDIQEGCTMLESLLRARLEPKQQITMATKMLCLI